MKRIPLTQGKFAIVDNENYEWLNQWRWYAQKRGKTFYAVRKIRVNGEQTRQCMHRLVLGLKKGDGKLSDHINHNGLDNRIANLRICNHTQNQRNQLLRIKLTTNKSSKYKGVYRPKKAKKWQSRITLNGKLFYIGYFDKEEQAAKAYDAKAIELFGEFAHLNFPIQEK